MSRIELVAPCHFGLEAVLKREIQDLGYEILQVEDGKVTFCGDENAVCRANIFLRTAERILLKVGKLKAVTFDELFEQIKDLPWEDYIPSDGKFWVAKASSVKSRLFSPSDIQSIVKKAIVERLKNIYHIEWFPETGAEYPIRISFMKDEALVCLDTTGLSLHKRGYRSMVSKAPIKETLAAALIMLTPWKKDRILVDPFCGSGTFPIEAAMIAANIAPGMNRSFTAEKWTNLLERKWWYQAVDEANDLVDDNIETDIRDYQSGQTECQRRGRGAFDPFSATSIEPTESPEEIWLSDQQSSLWRETGRKVSASRTVHGDRGTISKSGQLVHVSDYQL